MNLSNANKKLDSILSVAQTQLPFLDSTGIIRSLGSGHLDLGTMKAKHMTVEHTSLVGRFMESSN